MHRFGIVSVALLLSGCDDRPSAATAASGPVTTPSGPSASFSAASSAPSSASSATPAPRGSATEPFPDTESKPPTVHEWNGAKPLMVKFAPSLWCDTRQLREWVRVSCRAPEDASNQPLSLRVVRAPGRGQHYELVRAGVASLVLQPRRGQSSSFSIEWSKWGTRTLDVRFDAGASQPTLEFDQGAPVSKAGGPRCEDVCPSRQLFFTATGDCSIPCGEGYRCYPGTEETAAMCICDRCQL